MDGGCYACTISKRNCFSVCVSFRELLYASGVVLILCISRWANLLDQSVTDVRMLLCWYFGVIQQDLHFGDGFHNNLISWKSSNKTLISVMGPKKPLFSERGPSRPLFRRRGSITPLFNERSSTRPLIRWWNFWDPYFSDGSHKTLNSWKRFYKTLIGWWVSQDPYFVEEVPQDS